MSRKIIMKTLCIILIIVFYFVSASFAQTQYGEAGLFYTPSAFAILPGVFEFGIKVNNQFYKNNLEFPTPIFFAMGLAPRIESFASFPDIFYLGKRENLYQQYGNVGLKVRLINQRKKRLRFAVTTYLRYLTNSSSTNSYKNLPGCILHTSFINAQNKIFHIGLEGYQEASDKLNVKLNFGVETFFLKDKFIIYFDSYISPIKKKQWKKEWMGIISMMRWSPHRAAHIETGIGVEMRGKQGLIFVHLGVTFSSGLRIVYTLRKKKDNLPKPPPLEAVLQATSTEKENNNN